jgi:hypothetical protein
MREGSIIHGRTLSVRKGGEHEPGVPMDQLMGVFEQFYAWLGYFKKIDVIVPFLAAFFAGLYVKHQFKKASNILREDLEGVTNSLKGELKRTSDETKEDLKRALDETLGAFRAELRKATQSAKDSLSSTARKANSDIVSAEKKAEKEKFANSALQNSEEAATSGSKDELSKDDDAQAWGEISTMWSDVWSWIKDFLDEAIEGEKGRKKEGLQTLDLRSHNDVIVTLFNYGWFGDEASDLALEMSGLYLRHRSRKLKVTRRTLNRFRTLYEQWNSMDDE